MTLDELLAREAIRHTLASYNVYGDRLKVEELAALFTVDALLEMDGAPGSEGWRFEGRDAIAGFFANMTKAPKPADRGNEENPAAPTGAGRPFVRHHLSTIQITLTGPETADVRSYFAVYTQIGPDHCGFYTDRLRREGDAWLITYRRPRVDWTSPQSIFGQR